jgi:hypothetical protein
MILPSRLRISSAGGQRVFDSRSFGTSHPITPNTPQNLSEILEIDQMLFPDPRGLLQVGRRPPQLPVRRERCQI